MMMFRGCGSALSRATNSVSRRHAGSKAISTTKTTTPRSLSYVAAQQQHSQQQQPHNRRTFASMPPRGADKEVLRHHEQCAMWETYLSTGHGGQKLFDAIDLDQDGKISSDEIKFFLESIEVVVPDVAIGHLMRTFEPMDLQRFKGWLITATKFETGSEAERFKQGYESHPARGATKTAKKKAAAAAETEPIIVQEDQDELGDPDYSWNEMTMSQKVRRMQYAVRGEVVMRADALAAQGKDILYTNIGNPHAVLQPPITYYRQVMSLCDLPAEVGVDHPEITRVFPQDVVDRAKSMRSIIGVSGTGAYTHSQGLLGFREHVADFIQQRDAGPNGNPDDYPSYPGDIFLTNGASAAISYVLQTLLAQPNDAVMIPIPQYPIYSALIAKLGGRQVGYYLDEDMAWGVTREELEQRYAEARDQGLNVKALAMINPGNPSGTVMSRQDIETLCTFCTEHNIVLLADEVYQKNVYADDKEFISTKKVALETPECQDSLQLVSFHSTSKGLIGECGRRGGYMELHHICPYVKSQLYKLASSELCSGVAGQVMMSLMVKPPVPEDGESYRLFQQEEGAIFDGLKERAGKLVEGLNKIDGIDCVPADGAMYAFPRVAVPDGAWAAAKENETTPDSLYALSLLDETGICVVPASGFGQKEGRVGFRTTFLHPATLSTIDKFASHHVSFCRKYA